jgi:hypothetical protein
LTKEIVLRKTLDQFLNPRPTNKTPLQKTLPKTYLTGFILKLANKASVEVLNSGLLDYALMELLFHF